MAAEPPVLPGAEEARRWAAEELSQPEYRDAAPPWVETLWEDFLDWLSSLDGSPDPASTVPSPVIGLVIAVIIIAAVIIAKPRLNHRERQVKEVFGTESVLAAADYRRRAESSAAAGRWADAVVDRFRALVRSAEDRTILDPQPGRTADEVALSVVDAVLGKQLERRSALHVLCDGLDAGGPCDLADHADHRLVDAIPG